MSFFGDVLKFEAFNLKDMFGKLKDDPERALVGAVDPASSALWSEILGKKYEPLVDQMGGPYGGSTVSMGNSTGGVYGRAQDAGINTGPGGGMHDIAHAIAAIYGGQGLAGIGGAPANAGGQLGTYGQYGGMNANSGLGVFANGGEAGLAGVGGGNAGALAASGGLAGTGAGAYGIDTSNVTKAMKLLGDGGGGGGGGSAPVGSGPLGGSLYGTSPASTPEREQLDQRNRKLQGFKRTPVNFMGSTIWV